MLLYVSLFTILLSFLLLINNWKVNINARFLAFFLISSSIYGIAHYFVLYGKSPFWLAIFYNHFTPLMLLLGPLLFFYVRGTLEDSQTLKKTDWLHCIPALIHLVGIIPYLFLPFSEKLALAQLIIEDIDQIISINSNYFYTASFNFLVRPLLLLVYIFYCMYLIWKRFAVPNYDNNIPKKQLLISLRWLIILISSLFFIVIEFLIITVNSIHTKPSIGLVNSYPLYILSGAAYCVMSFSLLLFPNILYGFPKRKTSERTNTETQNKTDASVDENCENEDPFNDLTLAIQEYLASEKPFLNPDFSISDIASAMQVPLNHVSYCINTVMKIKFSDLKSDLRVTYSLELLSGKIKHSYTIEGIAHHSGFKTRANFYNAFKAKIGMTPTEYQTSNSLNNKLI